MKKIDFNLKPSKPCAVCHNPTHPGYLTAKTLREHDCINKNCHYFQKLEHDYWVQQERKYLEKKARKIYAQINPHWTKDDCYKAVKQLRIEDLRGFVEINSSSSMT